MNKNLLELEKRGDCVFHGSPNGNLEILEPRQGTHIPDMSKPTDIILDGVPAVSATPYAEFAAFRAIVNRKNIPFDHTSGFGFNSKKEKEFRVSSVKALDSVKNKKGYVYVFNKNEFEPYSRDGEPGEQAMEWRSYNAVRPIEIVEVSSLDLPSRDIIEFTNPDFSSEKDKTT